jgi:hypothetical protein
MDTWNIQNLNHQIELLKELKRSWISKFIRKKQWEERWICLSSQDYKDLPGCKVLVSSYLYAWFLSFIQESEGFAKPFEASLWFDNYEDVYKRNFLLLILLDEGSIWGEEHFIDIESL